ncbi:phage virion morphogenesis protein [Providencia rustigianii]|nr:phage virion morphogenesis protein [Providencia rustigianii]
MSDDTLRKLDSELGALISRMSANQRRQLAKEITRDLRRSQIKRIQQQKNPDGSAYTKRKASFVTVQREIQFMWRGQKRTLRHWRGNSKTITGQDADKKSQRSFRKSDIQRYISVKKTKSVQSEKPSKLVCLKNWQPPVFCGCITAIKKPLFTFYPLREILPVCINLD